MHPLLSSAACIAVMLMTTAGAAEPDPLKPPPPAKPEPNEIPVATPAPTATLQATPASPQVLAQAAPPPPSALSMTSRLADGNLGINANTGNTQIDAHVMVDPAKGQFNGIAVNVRVGPNN